jgi:transcriptional regulator with XRE-family HTH domain
MTVAPGRKPTSKALEARGKKLARQLRAGRQRRDLSQQELADRTRVSYTTVRKIEREETSNPGFFTVLDIADVLEIRLEDLAFRRQRGRHR